MILLFSAKEVRRMSRKAEYCPLVNETNKRNQSTLTRLCNKLIWSTLVDGKQKKKTNNYYLSGFVNLLVAIWCLLHLRGKIIFSAIWYAYYHFGHTLMYYWVKKQQILIKLIKDGNIRWLIPILMTIVINIFIFCYRIHWSCVLTVLNKLTIYYNYIKFIW